jgi:hypothetical protein
MSNALGQASVFRDWLGPTWTKDTLHAMPVGASAGGRQPLTSKMANSPAKANRWNCAAVALLSLYPTKANATECAGTLGDLAGWRHIRKLRMLVKCSFKPLTILGRQGDVNLARYAQLLEPAIDHPRTKGHV